MSEFSAIIYGRTYQVDFRLIIRPDDFDAHSIEWAKQYILPTMRAADKLRSKPRWSMFKKQRHLIIGVTCMASDICDSMLEDEVGRPLYVFVGYVARPPFDFYVSKDIDLFKPLYQKYVSNRWWEKSYETRQADAKAVTAYDQSLEVTPIDKCILTDIHLNFQENSLLLYPDIEEHRHKLWNSSFEMVSPMSICLGMPQKQDVLSSPFLNATTSDLENEVTLQRQLVKSDAENASSSSKEIAIDPSTSSREKKSYVRDQHQDDFYRGEDIAKDQQDADDFIEEGVRTVNSLFSGINSLINKLSGTSNPKRENLRRRNREESKTPKETSKKPNPTSNPDIFSGYLKPKDQDNEPNNNNSAKR